MFNAALILTIADLVYTEMDSGSSKKRLEGSGLLDLERRDKNSRSRLAHRDMDETLG